MSALQGIAAIITAVVALLTLYFTVLNPPGEQPSQQPQSSLQGEQPSRQPEIIEVTILDSGGPVGDPEWIPTPVQVRVGDTVRWSNLGTLQDSVASGERTWDGIFHSDVLNPRDTFEVTFTGSGEYPYFCSIHANRGGTVNVIPF